MVFIWVQSNYRGKLLNEESDFVKRQCLLFDLKANDRRIELVSFIVRKNSSFRIQPRFVGHDQRTYLILKIVSSLSDFDPYFSMTELDWTGFEGVVKVFGPIEVNSCDVHLYKEIKLAGEALENELCITNSNVFASLTHECAKLMDDEQMNVIRARRFSVHLNVSPIFGATTNMQRYTLSEFLSNDECASRSQFLDLRLFQNDLLFITYSKDAVSNSFTYDYREFKFKRDARCQKAAFVYDPLRKVVVRRLINVFFDETNIETVVFSDLFALDHAWNVFSLKTGACELNMRQRSLTCDHSLAHFLMQGRYLVSYSKTNTRLYVLRTSDSFVVASCKLSDDVTTLGVGEADRTILIGTQSGRVVGFKLVVDLEQTQSIDVYIKFYRTGRGCESDLRRANSDAPRTGLQSDLRRIAHSALEYRQLKSREQVYSRLSGSKCSHSSNGAGSVQNGVAKANLNTLSVGIRYANSHTRACIIQ